MTDKNIIDKSINCKNCYRLTKIVDDMQNY